MRCECKRETKEGEESQEGCVWELGNFCDGVTKQNGSSGRNQSPMFVGLESFLVFFLVLFVPSFVFVVLLGFQV